MLQVDNQDPLLDLENAAQYVGFKNARSLSAILSRGTYHILNQELIRIGRRPFFRRSTLENFLKSRTAAALLSSSRVA